MAGICPDSELDINYSVFCFQKLSERILQDTCLPVQLSSLKAVTGKFTINANCGNFNFPLTSAKEEEFVSLWIQLVRFSTKCEDSGVLCAQLKVRK